MLLDLHVVNLSSCLFCSLFSKLLIVLDKFYVVMQFMKITDNLNVVNTYLGSTQLQVDLKC